MLNAQYKNEPGYENYDKPVAPPTPVATPPPNNPISFSYPHRQLGSEKDAKLYIRKIRHETLRISVIQRLEEYLNVHNEFTDPSNPVIEETERVSDDSDDESTRRESSTEPQIGRWVDECKQLFLWYYDIYLVSSHL